jgi:hypothetical protein
MYWLNIYRVKELLSTQSSQEGSQERVSKIQLPSNASFLCVAHIYPCVNCWQDYQCSIKKPKTHRYPSLKGTDPKFRRNHRHALHGTMRALVRLHSLHWPRQEILNTDMVYYYRKRWRKASGTQHKFSLLHGLGVGMGFCDYERHSDCILLGTQAWWRLAEGSCDIQWTTYMFNDADLDSLPHIRDCFASPLWPQSWMAFFLYYNFSCKWHMCVQRCDNSHVQLLKDISTCRERFHSFITKHLPSTLWGLGAWRKGYIPYDDLEECVFCCEHDVIGMCGFIYKLWDVLLSCRKSSCHDNQ